ncbi:Uncharacterised protein [Rothia dentocariosa]|uniref:Uncharacterized protein n=1 Tax=Rothia dentocariosa TaxID=2047 RepID=A0A3S5BVA1_9MICC|nr:Uncharacterised protein [Rothia dentocariosa]
MNFVFDIDGTTSFNGMVIEPPLSAKSMRCCGRDTA